MRALRCARCPRPSWARRHAAVHSARPFAGAPSNAYTVYGATPQRNAAVIGFLARTTLTEARQVYLRYQGEVGSGFDNHTLNVGVRLTW